MVIIGWIVTMDKLNFPLEQKLMINILKKPALHTKICLIVKPTMALVNVPVEASVSLIGVAESKQTKLDTTNTNTETLPILISR